MKRKPAGRGKAAIDNYIIDIAGLSVSLTRCGKTGKRGKTETDEPRFDLYRGEFRGAEMLFLRPEDGNPTPGKCARISERIAVQTGRRPVFILDPAPAYDRRRLMEKDVYFVMSGKYAYLPMLVALEKARSRPAPKKLSAAAQYILLYHLQVEDIQGKPISAIASLMPYSLESVSLGLTCLCDLGLCEKTEIDAYSRTVIFRKRGRQLWDAALAYMASPVTRRYRCDTIGDESGTAYAESGTAALGDYAPQGIRHERRIMMTATELRRLRADGMEMLPYGSDGGTVVEVWKYPPVRRKGTTSLKADPLSAALTLYEEEDAGAMAAAEKAVNKILRARDAEDVKSWDETPGRGSGSIWGSVQERLRGLVSGPAKSGK